MEAFNPEQAGQTAAVKPTGIEWVKHDGKGFPKTICMTSPVILQNASGRRVICMPSETSAFGMWEWFGPTGPRSIAQWAYASSESFRVVAEASAKGWEITDQARKVFDQAENYPGVPGEGQPTVSARPEFPGRKWNDETQSFVADPSVPTGSFAIPKDSEPGKKIAEVMRARREIENMTIPGYGSLAAVLRDAYAQAACGKGAERHANDLPFNAQPMAAINKMLGSTDGFLYQAIKKAVESKSLPTPERRVAELLGAINYLAGAVIAIQAAAAAEDEEGLADD